MLVSKVFKINGNIETIRNEKDIYDVLVKYIGYDAGEWLSSYIRSLKIEIEHLENRIEELENDYEIMARLP